MNAPLPALLDRKQLQAELGCTRAVVDSVFRQVPTVHLQGLRKPMVKRTDVLALIDRSTYGKDQVIPR